MRGDPMSPSLKQKLKSSFNIAGCFRPIHHHNNHHRAPSPPQSPSPASSSDQSSHHNTTPSPKDHHNHKKTKSPRLSRTLSKSQDRCRSLIQRIGGVSGGGGAINGGGKHVRRHTTDFHYDPLSYSLNFDQGDDENLNEFPFRNFSSRLPDSPPSSTKAPKAAVK